MRLSVADLARRTSLAPSTIYDLERGSSHSTTKLHHFAAALNCSVRWLESGHGSAEPTAEETILAVAEESKRYGWPFKIEHARFERLAPDQREIIERTVTTMVDAFEELNRPKRMRAGARQ